jgi:mannose-6-phosphate isomerase-like protein (cupin superfamily)
LSAKHAVFEIDAVPHIEVPWGSTKFVVGPSPSPGGAIAVNVQVAITEYGPGYSHVGHEHPGQIEVIYILSGHGEHEHQDGTREPIGPGSLICVPPGSHHGNHNPSAEPLKAIIINVPPDA